MTQPEHTDTTDPREALVDALVPVAARLVAAVRPDGGGAPAVTELLATVPQQRTDALCVVLAAMVNHQAAPAELLAWTDQLPPLASPPGQLRGRVAEYARLVGAGVRPQVARVLAGPDRPSDRRARRAAVVADVQRAGQPTLRDRMLEVSRRQPA